MTTYEAPLGQQSAVAYMTNLTPQPVPTVSFLKPPGLSAVAPHYAQSAEAATVAKNLQGFLPPPPLPGVAGTGAFGFPV